VGVELSASSGAEQLDLLDPGRREKLERLARATDRLRDRFGFSKVQFAARSQIAIPAKNDGPSARPGSVGRRS
ncbi:MAG TPA: hypothetical protein VMJ13_02380, partial [Candidatus Acidoferrum sp.]|nr:hypothetical protein [Candidatus Acidoferrum sp.]